MSTYNEATLSTAVTIQVEYPSHDRLAVTLGGNARAIRMNQRLSVSSVAQVVRMLDKAFADCEAGLQRFTPAELLAVSHALGVPVSRLFQRHSAEE